MEIRKFHRRFIMEIPLNAQVECTDGVYGRSVFVLINPVMNQVTHLIVEEEAIPNTQRIVPVDFITETVNNTIRLRCGKVDLIKMDPFIKTRFIAETVPDQYSGYGMSGMYGMGSYYYMPFATLDRTVYEAVEDQQIPFGELAVRRGTRIEATDGYVGHVDEFLVNPDNCHITHLVMREGHLWGQKDVIIPLSAMGENHEDTLFLKLDKQQVESLPNFPVHRLWS
jgi:hypothetical protein